MKYEYGNQTNEAKYLCEIFLLEKRMFKKCAKRKCQSISNDQKSLYISSANKNQCEQKHSANFQYVKLFKP